MLPIAVRLLLCLPFAAGAFAQTPEFSKPLALPAQKSTLAITTADFNGDGFADIAAANAASFDVSIFLGTGSGTFSAAASVSVPSGCQVAYLANGNFTGGAGPDLLAVCPLGGVLVLPNKGHGTFGAPVVTPLPGPAWVGNLLLGDIHPAIADFNGDGHLDIAIQTFDLNALNGHWYLLLGKGNGSFQPATLLSFSGLIPLSIAAGDFNADGKPDLVTATVDFSANLFLEFAAGNGDGTFLSPSMVRLPSPSGSIILTADVNGDGKLDIVLAGAALFSNIKRLAQNSTQGQSAVDVLLGDGKGGFRLHYNATEETYMSGATLANFLGTGKLDMIDTTIQGNFIAGDPPTGAVELRAGNGDGTFANPVTLSIPSSTVPTDIVTGDFNGDGRPDIALASLPSQGVNLSSFSLDASLNSLLESILDQLPSGDADVLLNLTAPLTFSDANAASFAAGPIASGSIVSAFGSGLAAAPTSATSLPLLTTLGGVTVTIKDSSGASLLAPLFYVSPQQINYAIPDTTASGPATITIQSGGNIFTATQQIVPVAPGIFSANGLAVGSSARIVNGVQQVTPLLQNGALVPIDVSGGQTFVVLYGTGIRNHMDAVVATTGDTHVTAAYAGAQGVYLGEDQINIQLPASLQGAGLIGVSLLVDGQASNSVQILIK